MKKMNSRTIKTKRKRNTTGAGIFLSVLIVLLFFAPVTKAFAADSYKEYAFSDLSTTISLPDSLIGFTQNVSSNNSYLSLLNLDADDVEEFRSSMIANHIYLEAVPQDVSYEIVLTGQDAPSGLQNFDTCQEQDLQSLLEQYVAEGTSSQQVTDSALYTNGTTSFFVTDASTESNDVMVYARTYYTVMEGKVLTVSIQVKGGQPDDAEKEMLQQAVDSMQFHTVKASVFENSYVSEILSVLFRAGIPIAVLALVLLIVWKSTHKSQKKIDQEQKEREEILENRKKRGL